jgi:basic amino acid/polyamine antiporter, APA family
MALCGALCYGELAARFPEPGGGYVYLREAYGRAVAFMYGWMMLLVMDPGLTAALAIGLASYVGYGLNLSPVGAKVVAIAAIVLTAAANVWGVRLGASLVRWLTILKLGLLLFVFVWGFAFRLGSWSNFTPFFAQRPNSAPLIAALAAGMLGAFFSFGGWWDLSKLAGEVRRPAYTLPRALAYGVLIVTAVYILTSAVFLYLVPLDHVTSGETFAAQAGEALFGQVGGQVFSMIVIVAVLGSLAAVIMSAPGVYFAMARDGLFIPALASIHPRFETPARAIVIQALLASVLVLLGTFNQIVAYFIFVVVIFIGLTVATLFVLRRKDQVRPEYLTPGYPITPIIFLVLIAILLILLGSNSPGQSLVGVGVVMLSLPAYFLFRRRSREVSSEGDRVNPKQEVNQA